MGRVVGGGEAFRNGGLILFSQDDVLCQRLDIPLSDIGPLLRVRELPALLDIVTDRTFRVLICDTSHTNPHGVSCMPTVRAISRIGILALVTPDVSAQRIAAYCAGAESSVGRHADILEIGAVVRNLYLRVAAFQMR